MRLRFHKSQARAVVPGEFDYFVDPGQRPVLHQRLVFDLPAGKPLYADARGYVAEPPVTENGRTRYAFEYRRERFARIESGSVGYTQYGDRLMVTTCADYARFAKAYRDATADPGADDPAVRALAQSLTQNDADDRAKAKTLYDWVRRNIRYAAMFIGQSPAVPHRVTEVLANRYGDCKDHVALYGALLAALGIRSEPALIGLGSVYALPSVPGYGAGAINHVITWLPGLNVYAARRRASSSASCRSPTWTGPRCWSIPACCRARPLLRRSRVRRACRSTSRSRGRRTSPTGSRMRAGARRSSG